MIELGFSLDVVDDWPPFDVEHLWAERIDGNYEIKSIPFFTHGLCLGDIICADVDKNGYIIRWSLKSASLNSTVWTVGPEQGDFLNELETIGCQVEGGAVEYMFAVNIPANVSLSKFDSILKTARKTTSIDVAYATIRHA